MMVPDLDQAAVVDPSTLGVLQDISTARQLDRTQKALLLRAVTGAVRPNRDRPIWDICWLAVDLGNALPATSHARREELGIGGLLDPSEARRLLSAAAVGAERRWSRRDMPGLLAFAEFALTHEDCTWFAAMRAALAPLWGVSPDDAEQRVRDAVALISQRLRTFRVDTFAIGRHEKTFRSLATFMGSRDRRGSALADFDDEDVLAYWEHTLRLEGRVLFQTVVRRVITFREVLADLSSRAALANAAPLAVDPVGEEQNGPDEEIADGSDPDLAGDIAPGLEMLSDALPPHDGVGARVKALTGTERERLDELLACRDLPQRLPLTVLRLISFGKVQSGIANFLRRGGGGSSLAERVTCSQADHYDELLADYERLTAHIDRLLLIAGHLVAPPADTALAEQQKALAPEAAKALKRMKRMGFSGDRDTLAAALLRLSGYLIRGREMARAFVAHSRRLEAAEPLVARFERDRTRFAHSLTAAYRSTSSEGTCP